MYSGLAQARPELVNICYPYASTCAVLVTFVYLHLARQLPRDATGTVNLKKIQIVSFTMKLRIYGKIMPDGISENMNSRFCPEGIKKKHSNKYKKQLNTIEG